MPIYIYLSVELISQLNDQVNFPYRAALFAALLIQWGLIGMIFRFSLPASSPVWSVGKHREPWVFLWVNLRGISGVTKIEAEPLSSITDFWISIASPVISFPWLILSSLVLPITRAGPTSDGAHR